MGARRRPEKDRHARAPSAGLAGAIESSNGVRQTSDASPGGHAGARIAPSRPSAGPSRRLGRIAIAARARLSWWLSDAYTTGALLMVRPVIERRIRSAVGDGPLAAALRSLFGSWSDAGGEQLGPLVELIERRRTELSRRPGRISLTGAGGRPRALTAPFLAYYSSIPPRWGRLLLRCAQAVRARTIVEVGACMGVSGSYLAAAPSCRTFVTFEPSATLAAIATESIGAIHPHCHVVARPFDEGFGGGTALFPDGVDLVYIDSSHDEASTVDPVLRLIPYLTPGAILLLDDIRWSPVMWRNWQTVRQQPGMSLTLDLGRMGLCVWSGPPPRLPHHDLSRLLGWWRLHKRNAPAGAR